MQKTIAALAFIASLSIAFATYSPGLYDRDPKLVVNDTDFNYTNQSKLFLAMFISCLHMFLLTMEILPFSIGNCSTKKCLGYIIIILIPAKLAKLLNLKLLRKSLSIITMYIRSSQSMIPTAFFKSVSIKSQFVIGKFYQGSHSPRILITDSVLSFWKLP